MADTVCYVQIINSANKAEVTYLSHIVESCPLTRLNGGLSRPHSADEDAVSWVTNYTRKRFCHSVNRTTDAETDVDQT